MPKPYGAVTFPIIPRLLYLVITSQGRIYLRVRVR